jgi:hypothetical protein
VRVQPRRKSRKINGGFTGCGKTNVSYQGIALQLAEKLGFRIRVSL